jgi:hypothetical protein
VLVVIGLPVGWNSERYLTSRHHTLSGLGCSTRITVDIGDPQIISAGDVLQIEDAAGSGHVTEVVSGTPFEVVKLELSASAG